MQQPIDADLILGFREGEESPMWLKPNLEAKFRQCLLPGEERLRKSDGH
ncbi:MAG: hypothetical protein GY799_07780, partial [Desulfobulbaceae bacterium]|nr:hypothetical protein [Desulfobulbaceae bacterium]